MEKEVGWAGEEARRPLKRLLTPVVGAPGRCLHWDSGVAGEAGPVLTFRGTRASECGLGSSEPWVPIHRVLETIGKPSSRNIVPHLAKTISLGGKM